MLCIESIWFALVRDYAGIPYSDIIIGLLHSMHSLGYSGIGLSLSTSGVPSSHRVMMAKRPETVLGD